jgi:hypothetical protein
MKYHSANEKFLIVGLVDSGWNELDIFMKEDTALQKEDNSTVSNFFYASS